MLSKTYIYPTARRISTYESFVKTCCYLVSQNSIQSINFEFEYFPIQNVIPLTDKRLDLEIIIVKCAK